LYEDEIDLRVYVDLLLRYRRFIVAFAVLAAVLAFLISSFLPPVYEASAALLISPQRSNMVLTRDFTLSEENLGQISLSQRADALVQIAQSLETAALVSEARPEFLDVWETGSAALVDAVDVAAKGDLLVVTASANDPQVAADLATTWMQVTVDQLNEVYSVNAETVDEVSVQMADAWQAYQEAQTALEAFLAESTIPELENQVRLLESSLSLATQNQQLSGLYAQEALLQQQLTNALALKAQLEASGGSAADAWGTSLAFITLQSQAYGSAVLGQAYETVIPDTQVRVPGQNYQNVTPSLLQLDLSTGAPALTPEDVDNFITVLRDKRVMLEEQITTLVEQTEDGESTVVTGNLIAERIQSLAGELAALQAKLENASAQELQLENARDVAWTTYTSLSNKLRELNVENAVSTSEARAAFEAVKPAKPSKPSRMLNTLVAGALGLALGIFAAFLLEYLTPASARAELAKTWQWFLVASGLPNYTPASAGNVHEVDPVTPED